MARPPKAKPSTASIAGRWTPVLAKHGGYTPVVDGFMEHYSELGITSGEAMFLLHVIRHKWGEDMPFPGFPGIAEKMGVTPTAARKYARDLEDRALLKRIGRAGQTTQFDLSPLFAKLEELLPESPPSRQSVQKPRVARPAATAAKEVRQ